jgi:hypothetical protein
VSGVVAFTRLEAREENRMDIAIWIIAALALPAALYTSRPKPQPIRVRADVNRRRPAARS